MAEPQKLPGKQPADPAGAIKKMPWYQLSATDTLQSLGVQAKVGLSSAEAQARQEQYGPNELVEKGGRTKWQILRDQLTGILTLILFAAAVISFVLAEHPEEYIDGFVILAIIVLNAALGYTQELKAEQSMAALKRMAVPHVRIRRDGRVQEISARDLVPGDIVLLETGNVVPADGRVLESTNMRVMEAALTGESEAVDKDSALVFTSDKALGDRRNMVYSGTVVNYGRGEIIVTEIGMQTELGHIAELIQSVVEEKTPLQDRLDKLGKYLAVGALILVAVIFTLGILRDRSPENIERMLLTSVSLAVAAIPEALTAVVTIALSLGAQRMLKRQALIRKLPAVETLGSVSVICSDKTGTLTQNRMTVTALDIANHQIDLVQRPGEKHFLLDIPEGHKKAETILPTLDLLLISGALCNDAVLVRQDKSPESQNDSEQQCQGDCSAVGDPTEGALVLAAAEYGIMKDVLEAAFPRVGELPFDSVRKRMTTVHRTPQSPAELPTSLMPIWERRLTTEAPPYLAFTKGAVDGMLAISSQVWVEGKLEPFDASWEERIQTANEGMAKKGMRVLGVGLRGFDHQPTQEELQSVEQNLILVGLFGMIDPPRPEVAEAIGLCKTAGIRPVMITGDHPLTARHIAQQLGMTDNDEFITGQELDKLSEVELIEKANRVSVFARVSPEHKLKLIQAFQSQQLIVSMTGDGVNDAPALRKADIGVAMGITGTDVAKEAAEMVLLDDNFATIVAAVEEGRVIYDNIRRFIKYLLSCNASEIAVMLIGPLLGMPIPLLPLQILWMNLVTDGLPALALGVEPAEKNVMKRPPYSSTESVFGRGMLTFIIVIGIVMSLISIGIGLIAYNAGDPAWQTLLFTTLIFAQLALALEARSEEESLFRLGVFTNRSMIWAIISTLILQLLVVYVPFLQTIFDTDPLGWQDLLTAFLAGLGVIVVVEVWKWFMRRRSRI
ncbi:MAG: pacL [Chloroflexi bacterium]|nr:pacL [Chloroflexota bacterium]